MKIVLGFHTHYYRGLGKKNPDWREEKTHEGEITRVYEMKQIRLKITKVCELVLSVSVRHPVNARHIKSYDFIVVQFKFLIVNCIS